VRGLMQITGATARELGINRLDPMQSISGGSKYLKILYDRLEPYGLEQWDRWFFALAAYNQGWGSLTDAIKLSQRLGGSGNTWREVKEVFPLLARSKYYRQAEHGYARGWEAVNYVDSIRYYYYVLQGLVILSRPEAKDLPALVPPVALAGS
jgi:membrane-bound lytic murein transglycosylase F